MKSLFANNLFGAYPAAQISRFTKRGFWIRILAITSFWATSSLSQNVSEDIVKIGEFNTSSTVAELLGKGSAQFFEQIIPVDKPVEWAIYVPKNYDSKAPAGILVFISANNSGKIPNECKK